MLKQHQTSPKFTELLYCICHIPHINPGGPLRCSTISYIVYARTYSWFDKHKFSKTNQRHIYNNRRLKQHQNSPQSTALLYCICNIPHINPRGPLRCSTISALSLFCINGIPAISCTQRSPGTYPLIIAKYPNCIQRVPTEIIAQVEYCSSHRPCYPQINFQIVCRSDLTMTFKFSHHRRDSD